MSVGTEGSGPNPRTYSRADYAALEAENARLVREAKNDAIAYKAVLERQDELRAERDSALAQLAAIQGGMGEDVDTGYKPDARIMQTLANLATRKPLHNLQAIGEARSQVSIRQLDSMLHEAGCDLADYAFTLRQDFDALHAQHQRITAAMAAEVERWERSFRDIHEPALRDAHAYIQELRAELAEVKGREAVPVAYISAKSIERLSDPRIHGASSAIERRPTNGFVPFWLAPPASPDVEGLVKALELWLADYDEVAANPDFEPHPHVAERVAKSRAALSTWRQSHP